MYEYFGQQGWVCPKCGRVYSPTTSMCFFCSGNNTVTVGTNTPINTPVEKDSDWEDIILKNTYVLRDFNPKVTYTSLSGKTVGDKK